MCQCKKGKSFHSDHSVQFWGYFINHFLKDRRKKIAGWGGQDFDTEKSFKFSHQVQRQFQRLISVRQGFTDGRGKKRRLSRTIALPEMLFWFVLEDGQLWTDMRTRTLLQTEFLSFVVYCWIPEGWYYFLNSGILIYLFFWGEYFLI